MPLPDLTDAELMESRKLLLHFTRLQLPDYPDLAEDLVQETLLSAYSAGDSFQGRALVNSWLFAILKNKIIDTLRQIGRQRKVFTALDDELLDETFESHFFPNGHWTPEGQPQHWNTPEKSLNNNEFQKILQSCLYNLPENTARVFTLKEILGFSSNEIQQMCGISTANYHTIMHRARESLRQCLQIKWFNQENLK
ncbi:sigma-70 family RNA polymerase sigma factor [Neisseria cinerea]|uniref:RNA polymerase sigma factor n=1 Tax=Neisseria cinerea ATCC 14685 TaxID=546262 RepID=D0W3Y5_NEICI|nr:sigma-70 family RNA polymerase sigma factor [Neisseria cinerea]EEZ71533.1 RNA polymerase sigma-70 factor, TIGR02943 family [Neisseria cinerea ATCC 14685]MCD2070801.1 sigma-70 family RNA polymerase sigma factor [Neisseria cinerea]